MQNILSAFLISFYLFIAFGSDNNKTNNSNLKNEKTSSDNLNESKGYEPCYGSENCVDKVRNNFRNAGKQILSEEYLGRGKFGITFLDPLRGEAYNADVSTDCNCIISNVRVTIVQ